MRAFLCFAGQPHKSELLLQVVISTQSYLEIVYEFLSLFVMITSRHRYFDPSRKDI